MIRPEPRRRPGACARRHPYPAVGWTAGVLVLVLCLGGLGCARTSSSAAGGPTGTSPPVTHPVGSGPSPTPAASTGSAVVGLAHEVVTHFASSRYQHRRQPATTDPTGTFDTDCSGFVDYLLARVAPEALRGVPVDAGHSHPLAHDFAELPAPSGLPAGWQQVSRVADLRPGDLISWTEPLDVNTDDTGHVMVVAAAPTAAAGPDHVDVAVIDATASPHGPTDSRQGDPRNQPDARTHKPSGVGDGTITVLTDPDGRPTGYRWSTDSARTEHPDRITLLRLGR